MSFVVPATRCVDGRGGCAKTHSRRWVELPRFPWTVAGLGRASYPQASADSASSRTWPRLPVGNRPRRDVVLMISAFKLDRRVIAEVRCDDAACCTTQQQNAHITEQREVLYRWHPWHGRTVSIVGAMVRGGVATFRCRADDSSRCCEVPQWMFDAATCCRTQLVSQSIVACRALYDLRDLIQATERISSTPVLQAEHLIPHATGGAHATQNSRNVERAVAAVSADSATALDQRTGGSTRARRRAARQSAVSARSRAPRIGGAR